MDVDVGHLVPALEEDGVFQPAACHIDCDIHIAAASCIVHPASGPADLDERGDDLYISVGVQRRHETDGVDRRRIESSKLCGLRYHTFENQRTVSQQFRKIFLFSGGQKEAGVAIGKLKILNKIHIVPVRILNRFYHEALHPFALE